MAQIVPIPLANGKFTITALEHVMYVSNEFTHKNPAIQTVFKLKDGAKVYSTMPIQLYFDGLMGNKIQPAPDAQVAPSDAPVTPVTVTPVTPVTPEVVESDLVD